jgi:dihydroxyacetone kinase DhaKLM complex PTS-EIIA-like component DhaM
MLAAVRSLAESIRTEKESGNSAAAQVWHNCGMTRIRLSTTVSKELLDSARAIRSNITDATLIDEALEALLVRHRSAEVDASYAAAYQEHPIDEPDEWGDLASFRQAAAAT